MIEYDGPTHNNLLAPLYCDHEWLDHSLSPDRLSLCCQRCHVWAQGVKGDPDTVDARVAALVAHEVLNGVLQAELRLGRIKLAAQEALDDRQSTVVLIENPEWVAEKSRRPTETSDGWVLA